MQNFSCLKTQKVDESIIVKQHEGFALVGESDVGDAFSGKSVGYACDGGWRFGNDIADQQIASHKGIEISTIAHEFFPIVIGKIGCPARWLNSLCGDAYTKQEEREEKSRYDFRHLN